MNRIVISRLQNKQSISELLPFVSQEMLQRLFEAASIKN